MHIDLKHLRALSSLAETGSLAAAAERLHLTQSPLSHQLKALLALPSDHPLAERTWIEPDDLRTETLITYPVERHRLNLFHRFFDPAGVEPAAVRHTEVTLMMMQLVASGRCLCALPDWALAEYLERDYVEARRLGSAGLHGELYAAMRDAQSELAWMEDILETARRQRTVLSNSFKVTFFSWRQIPAGTARWWGSTSEIEPDTDR